MALQTPDLMAKDSQRHDQQQEGTSHQGSLDAIFQLDAHVLAPVDVEVASGETYD